MGLLSFCGLQTKMATTAAQKKKKKKLRLLLSKATVPFESKIDWSIHWIVLYNMYVFIVLVAKPRWPPLLDIDLK